LSKAKGYSLLLSWLKNQNTVTYNKKQRYYAFQQVCGLMPASMEVTRGRRWSIHHSIQVLRAQQQVRFRAVL